jgi:hypothetical protein
MSSDAPGYQLENRLRILGTCWVIYGVIRLVAAAWLVSCSATATLMFGSLLNRVPDPFSLMNLFHVIYTFIIVLSIFCGILGLVAGVALLAGHRVGHNAAIVAAFLSISEIPLGITLGTYTLVVMLPLRASQGAEMSNTSSRLRRQPYAT